LIVAVTGLGTASEPEAGFGVLKSLNSVNNRNYRLIGLAYKPMETGLFHPGLMDRAFIVPLPRLDQEAFLGRIRQIRKEAGLDIIIPNIDEDIAAFADMEVEFGAMGIETLLPGRQSLREMQSEINRRLEKQKNVSSKDDDKDSAVLPSSLIKNPVSEQAHQDNRSNLDLFAVAVIADRKSKIVALAAVKKILLSRYGGTWMALTVDGGEFGILAEKLVKDTSWRGPLTIEVVRNCEGEQYVTGVHPVFPDWINLAQAAGVNLPAILIDVIRRKKMRGIAPIIPGKVLVRSSIDIVTDLSHFGNISLNGEISYDQQ
jgi:carbamoyl-phosphate synthase large subunit